MHLQTALTLLNHRISYYLSEHLSYFGHVLLHIYIYIYIYVVKSTILVVQSFPTLCSPMDCSPPGSSVPGIFLARILEWGAIPLFRVLLHCRQFLYCLSLQGSLQMSDTYIGLHPQFLGKFELIPSWSTGNSYLQILQLPFRNMYMT